MAVLPEICTVFARGGLFRSDVVRKLASCYDFHCRIAEVANLAIAAWMTTQIHSLVCIQIDSGEPTSGAATLRCNPVELKNSDRVLELACFRLFIPIPTMMSS